MDRVDLVDLMDLVDLVDLVDNSFEAVLLRLQPAPGQLSIKSIKSIKSTLSIRSTQSTQATTLPINPKRRDSNVRYLCRPSKQPGAFR